MAALRFADILQQRLHNQRIAAPASAAPAEIVGRLGAVQAQDFAGAKWALGLRLHGATDAAIEHAFAAGAILRTHLMRPTWHFVTPADIRWILALTAARTNAASGSWYRKLELDDATFLRGEKVLAQALEGGRQLTRPELLAVLQQAGLVREGGLRFIYILGWAELAGLICSGARRGKQFTYALLDERAPATRPLAPDEALAELTRRYFTSHGPATVQDFVWWSGLTGVAARAGLAMLADHLRHEVVDDQTYWFARDTPPAPETQPTAYLLPNFDEYMVAYTDRSGMFDSAHAGKLDARGNILFNNPILIGGRVAGTWTRTLKKSAVVVEAALFAPLTAAETRAIALAAERYGAFLDLPVVLSGA